MASRRARVRRLVGVVVVLTLLAAGVVLLRVGPDLPRSAGPTDGPATSAGPAPSTAATTAPAPPTPDAVEVTAPPEATAAPAGPATPSLPETGPGLTEPGALLIATPLADGTVDVQEIVYLPEPVDSLDLAPPDLADAGTDFADREAAVTDLQVSAGGGPVPVPVAGIVAPVRIAVPGVDRVEASYRLHDTVVRSVPSTARRGLLAVAPSLDLGDLPVQVLVAGEDVLNLSCPLLPDVADRTCAAGSPPLVRTESPLPASRALVVAQLDLPRV